MYHLNVKDKCNELNNCHSVLYNKSLKTCYFKTFKVNNITLKNLKNIKTGYEVYNFDDSKCDEDFISLISNSKKNLPYCDKNKSLELKYKGLEYNKLTSKIKTYLKDILSLKINNIFKKHIVDNNNINISSINKLKKEKFNNYEHFNEQENTNNKFLVTLINLHRTMEIIYKKLQELR